MCTILSYASQAFITASPMKQNLEKRMSCYTGHHSLEANPFKAKPYSGTHDGELTNTSSLHRIYGQVTQSCS